MTETADPRATPFHPRLRNLLYGQETAEQKLLSAYSSGRFHHAWLLAGPRGIGKATLAYRFARFVLKHPDASLITQRDLHVDPEDPVAKRVMSRGHTDLLTIERRFDEKTKRLKLEIGADEARQASEFFTRTAGEGGWRICIVDAADDLNGTSANALLKILEEPPEKSLFLLVSHSPGRLLPTIRSRCLKLNLQPLDGEVIEKILNEVAPEHVGNTPQIAELATGSAGRALETINSTAGEKLEQFLKLVSAGTPFDKKAMWALSGQLALRGKDTDYQLFSELFEQWLMNRAKNFASTSSDLAQSARWADQSLNISHSIRRANALNLDRREVMLEAFETIEGIERAGRRI